MAGSGIKHALWNMCPHALDLVYTAVSHKQNIVMAADERAFLHHTLPHICALRLSIASNIILPQPSVQSVSITVISAMNNTGSKQAQQSEATARHMVKPLLCSCASPDWLTV